MRQGMRLTEAERTELRRRIAAGETFARAAAAVRCSTKSIYRLLTGSRGLTRRTTPRAALRLSAAEREEISRGVGAAESCRAIAQRSGAVDRGAGYRGQRRAAPLSRLAGRRAGGASQPTPEGAEAGELSPAAPGGGTPADAPLVAATARGAPGGRLS